MSQNRKSMRGLVAGLVGLALVLIPAGAGAGGGKRPVVVELFTSQGCSSCPSADSLVGQLSTRKDVIALSLPITYWDMLGWKDTLANDANTRRQKAYSTQMGHGGVYTPQIVIDGVSDAAGNRDQLVLGAISARAADMQAIQVTLSATPDEVHISVGGAWDKAPHDATIWLFHILSKATVSIRDGENAGRTLTYHNIVRDVRPVGVWKGQPISLDLPRRELTHTPHDAVAVVVQQGGYGRVVGAAFIEHPDYYFVP
jgi:hypothetical protein